MNDYLFLNFKTTCNKMECLSNRRFPFLQVVAQQDQAAGQDEENYKYRIRKRNYIGRPCIEEERFRFADQLLSHRLPGEQHYQHHAKNGVQ